MGRKKKGGGDGAAAHADESVPFGFLLGEQYSGYYQALNSSKDLKVRRSTVKMARLFTDGDDDIPTLHLKVRQRDFY